MSCSDPLRRRAPFRDVRRQAVLLAARAYGRDQMRSTSCSGSRDISAMSSPAKVTDSASGLSRLPWQTGQSALDMNCDTRRLHHRALGGGEGLQDVSARAGERAL